MTQTESTTTGPASSGKRMLIGGAIGFVLITLFLVSAGPGDPAWGKFWMIRPLIMTPLAGAIGGLCSYYIMRFAKQFGMNKVLAIVLSLFVFIVGLWLGTILGLDGTWWD